ncbi:MAG: 2Fe-2S iron-sulfur cluster-binding protein [Aquificaceae bacterium]|nr:2Fe-2S iron-sulfur cluster-binding protein [Aquificaceae bacterium]MDW8293857.1 2Fe-2S iron-sulfur cluster-binding protein [Aquificaceae bacterium]
MKVRIRRYPGDVQEFNLDISQKLTLLDLLYRIREEIDPSLSFRSMCRAGVCGTCGVRLKGKPVLACSTWVSPEEELDLEPLEGYAPIKDLVVDQEGILRGLRGAKLWLRPFEDNKPIQEGLNQKTSKSWECILCGICDSVCPVLTNPSPFGGPMILTRGYKHLLDLRNSNPTETLQNLYSLRPDLCTHCMNCSYACPKKLMPEALIKEEENLLVERGLLQREVSGFDFLSF